MSGVVAAVAFAALSLLETWRPLRRRTAPRGRRVAVNLAVAATGAAVVGLVQGAVVGRAARWAEARGVGVIRWLRVPAPVTGAASVVLLDYTLWIWHRLTHRVPWLWRTHAAHHADVDLDASTALRFHPGELLASVPYRAAQVVALGVTRRALERWQLLTLLAILFHHANARLPARLEAALSWLVITPRLHGIHHSTRAGELHSNFGTILALWDALHGLRVTGVPQERIAIGLAGMTDRPPLGVRASLALPLARELPPRGV